MRVVPLSPTNIRGIRLGGFGIWDISRIGYFGLVFIGMKRQALKAKNYCSFWSSLKRRKGFPKINDIVKSELQK